jgi:hypothetical protein
MISTPWSCCRIDSMAPTAVAELPMIIVFIARLLLQISS